MNWASVPEVYALSPTVKTVPGMASNNLAVCSSPVLLHDDMSPAPTRVTEFVDGGVVGVAARVDVGATIVGAGVVAIGVELVPVVTTN